MSDLLYHVKRTIISYDEDASGATRTVDILGTFTNLAAAKAAANAGLASEGYLPSDFSSYEQRNETATENWKYSDGVMVFAIAPDGQHFEVSIDTEMNSACLKGNAGGEVEGVLHYVLQTTINYNTDRTGSCQNTVVASTHTTRASAYAAALTTLISNEVSDGPSEKNNEITQDSFAEYDTKGEFEGEWPYGEECFVHAVGLTGENFEVWVKAQLKRGRKGEGEGGCGKDGCMCDEEEGCGWKVCKKEGGECAA